MTDMLMLLEYINQEIHNSELYKLLTQGTLHSPSFNDIKDVLHVKPLVDVKLESEFKNKINYLQIFDEENSCSVICSNIFTKSNCKNTDILSSALVQNREVFICRMLDGTIHAIPIVSAHDRDDIVAVLAFPPTQTLCLRWESSHEWIESKGCLENCSNLIYVAPIPEGVEDIAGIFTNCKKLNCPIYLPSTIKWTLQMLDGCESFSSNIYMHESASKDIGLGEFSRYLKIL